MESSLKFNHVCFHVSTNNQIPTPFLFYFIYLNPDYHLLSGKRGGSPLFIPFIHISDFVRGPFVFYSRNILLEEQRSIVWGLILSRDLEKGGEGVSFKSQIFWLGVYGFNPLHRWCRSMCFLCGVCVWGAF